MSSQEACGSKNDGEMLYLTKALSCSMDMDNRDFTLLTMHGSWARAYVRTPQSKKGFMGVGIRKR